MNLEALIGSKPPEKKKPAPPPKKAAPAQPASSNIMDRNASISADQFQALKPTMAKKKTVAKKKALDLSSSDDDQPKQKLKLGANYNVRKASALGSEIKPIVAKPVEEKKMPPPPVRAKPPPP